MFVQFFTATLQQWQYVMAITTLAEQNIISYGQSNALLDPPYLVPPQPRLQSQVHQERDGQKKVDE